MRYGQTFLLFLCVLGLLSACSQAQQQTKPILIGQVAALTGYGAEWGTAEREAVQLAVDEINARGGIDGRNLSVIAEDSQTDATSAVTALNKLAADGINIVIGPTWEASASSIMPIAKQSDLLLITPSSYKSVQEAHATTLFSTYPPYEYEITNLIPFFEQKKMERFAIISNDEFFSTIMRDLFKDEAKKNGWEVVGVFEQPQTDKDYKTILLKIKGMNADAIYAPLAANDPDQGILMRQMKQAGMTMPLIGTSSTENQNLLNNYADDIEGVIYPYPVDAPGYAEFSIKFKQKYGKEPESPSAATAYDAAQLIIAALKSGANTPEDIALYLHNVRDYKGTSNVISFDRDGIIENKVYKVKTVRNGRFEDY